MPEGLVVVLLLVALVAAGVALNVAILRHNHRKYAEHPEKRPYGWNLALRAAPFAAICAAFAVWGVIDGRWLYVVIGVLGVVCFAIDLARRWQRPAA